MKIGVIISKRIENQFGLLANQMLKELSLQLIEIEDFPLYLKDKDLEKYDCEYFIAVAIHSLQDHPKRFCVHVCGNWNQKWPRQNFDLGGEQETLCGHSPSLLRFIYQSLIKHNNLPEFAVNIEATHHGPDIKKPILMLEIGSNQEAWSNKQANSIVCEVIKDAINNFAPDKKPASLVLGGDHYMKELESLLHKKDILIGHMCPSSQIENFSEKMLLESMRKTEGGIKNAIINISGVGQHYEKITSLLKKHNIDIIHLHEIVPLRN